MSAPRPLCRRDPTDASPQRRRSRRQKFWKYTNASWPKMIWMCKSSDSHLSQAILKISHHAVVHSGSAQALLDQPEQLDHLLGVARVD